jgi:hypothetical protein
MSKKAKSANSQKKGVKNAAAAAAKQGAAKHVVPAGFQLTRIRKGPRDFEMIASSSSNATKELLRKFKADPNSKSFQVMSNDPEWIETFHGTKPGMNLGKFKAASHVDLINATDYTVKEKPRLVAYITAQNGFATWQYCWPLSYIPPTESPNGKMMVVVHSCTSESVLLQKAFAGLGKLQWLALEEGLIRFELDEEDAEKPAKKVAKIPKKASKKRAVASDSDDDDDSDDEEEQPAKKAKKAKKRAVVASDSDDDDSESDVDSDADEEEEDPAPAKAAKKAKKEAAAKTAKKKAPKKKKEKAPKAGNKAAAAAKDKKKK